MEKIRMRIHTQTVYSTLDDETARTARGALVARPVPGSSAFSRPSVGLQLGLTRLMRARGRQLQLQAKASFKHQAIYADDYIYNRKGRSPKTHPEP